MKSDDSEHKCAIKDTSLQNRAGNRTSFVIGYILMCVHHRMDMYTHPHKVDGQPRATSPPALKLCENGSKERVKTQLAKDRG